ncbi:MAG: molybdopterin biosynthesis protein [Methanoregula sp.]|jgi:putative molybdopterin biosynthesis protein|nr:molybdopterin biosynthesis protein [Methanoregula sp.]
MVKRYLTLCSLERALHLIKTSFPVPSHTEKVPLINSIGRVIAKPVYAKYTVPEVNISAMDGIAVRSRDTIGAADQIPVTLYHFARVNTGNIIPPEFDAVIMIEDTWETGGQFQIRKSAAPWQYIRHAGEDIRENSLVLPKGHLVRAFDIGALATYGITHVEVQAVQVGIIPTGSELVPLGVRPGPGQVVESNTIMAQVFLSTMGACCTRFPIVPDDPKLITDALRSAVRSNDLVIISAGSSAGTRDFTAGVISSLGELLFHGVAVKPGKPVLLGRIDGKPVLGLPGYPLAAQTILREFAAPLLETWGFAPPPRYPVRVRLSQPLSSDLGFDVFVPVFVGRIGSTLWGVPHHRGHGVQMATVKANGYTQVPASLEGYNAESELDVFLTTDPGSIERTLILSGSLDPAIEALANLVHDEGFFIHASNVGNVGALLALKRNSCHAAPMDLPALSLLPESRFLMDHLPTQDIAFIHMATIEQGIASHDGLILNDLFKVRFINTRKGTPTRIVFDALLSSRSEDPSRIDGYLHEVNGPQAVAAAIQNGFADAGVCTSSVAEAYGLQFVPIANEDYELAVKREMLNDPRICSLISLIKSSSYETMLEKTGGYDSSHTGMIRSLSENNLLEEFHPALFPLDLKSS